jgi:hypothetical protein
VRRALEGDAGRRAAFCVIAVAGALLAGPVAAHDLGSSPVHPVLGPLPPALAGLTVEVAETLAPQVLVTNHGPAVLSVLDESGRPFVRIGPKGVEADLNALAWYKTLSTSAVPEPAAARDPRSPANWHLIDHGRSFGWFDPRLAVARYAPTPAMRAADVPASTGDWRIPVRIGATATALSGHFEYVPPADGAYVNRLVPAADFPSGISFMISQGAIPAILMMDGGRHDVTLIGLKGEDEVRLDRNGVAVNTASPTWRHWGQEQRGGVAGGRDGWMTVSRQGWSYLWLEPRGANGTGGDTHPDMHWTLPLRVDGRSYAVSGNAVWKDTEHREVAAR